MGPGLLYLLGGLLFGWAVGRLVNLLIVRRREREAAEVVPPDWPDDMAAAEAKRVFEASARAQWHERRPSYEDHSAHVGSAFTEATGQKAENRDASDDLNTAFTALLTAEVLSDLSTPAPAPDPMPDTSTYDGSSFTDTAFSGGDSGGGGGGSDF